MEPWESDLFYLYSRIVDKLLVVGPSDSYVLYLVLLDTKQNSFRSIADDAEETHWEVLRRFHEFYILESKLTEFHGEFQYNTLPSRRSLFTSTHASDFMITRKQVRHANENAAAFQ